MRNSVSISIFLLVGLTSFAQGLGSIQGIGYAQGIGYEVIGTQTNPFADLYQLLTLDTVASAKTLKDINAKYRPDWVASYIGVEVSTTCDGVVKKAKGSNDHLTAEQKDLLRSATADCAVDVLVDYIPDNNLQYNPPRQMSFSLRMMPIYEAQYPGGRPALNTYLKQNIVDKISDAALAKIELARVRFKISEQGQVIDAEIHKTTSTDQIDKQLLDAICNMPQWTAATNAQGKSVSQEFEFSLGTALARCDYRYNF